MSEKMKIAVILPAAGKGERLGEKVPKAEVELVGKPLFLRSVELFQKDPRVKQIIVAVAPDRLDVFKFLHGDKLSFFGVDIVEGGEKERWETIMKAGRELDEEITHVAVHDAARPLCPQDVIKRVFDAGHDHSCVIPGTPAASTLKYCEQVIDEPKEVEDAGISPELESVLDIFDDPETDNEPAVELYKVVETRPRDGVYLIQTPQMLERELFDSVYKRVSDGEVDSAGITDDAGLVELCGGDVHLVLGDEMNIKITRPADLKLAELMVKAFNGGKDDDLGPKRLFPTWAESEDD